jgi:hypothetical protein
MILPSPGPRQGAFPGLNARTLLEREEHGSVKRSSGVAGVRSQNGSGDFFIVDTSKLLPLALDYSRGIFILPPPGGGGCACGERKVGFAVAGCL